MARIEDYDLELHAAALILGDPVAQAYEWLKAYADNLTEQCKDDVYGGNRPVTVEDLLSTADSHQPDQNTRGWGGDYLVRGGAFEGDSVDPTFWKYYAIFREIPLENVEQSSFFSCSC